jgi:hypothetical protein
MLASAVATAWSTYLYWLPCRGSMLEGTLIKPIRDDGGSYEDFQKLDPAVKAKMFACEARMDGDVAGLAPWTDELWVVAMVLLGVAWLALVLRLRWQLRTRALAALPGLVTLAAALAATGRDRENLPPMWLLFSIELAAVVALVAISAWQQETHGRHIRRLAVVLWGTTAFGAIHTIAEYVAMIIFSERDWDTPPGTGYLTAAVIAVSAILTVIMTLRVPQRVADDERIGASSALSRR